MWMTLPVIFGVILSSLVPPGRVVDTPREIIMPVPPGGSDPQEPDPLGVVVTYQCQGFQAGAPYSRSTSEDLEDVPLFGWILGYAGQGPYGSRHTTNDEVYMGYLVHVTTEQHCHQACGGSFTNVPSEAHWVALIQRGKCSFQTKIQTAIRHNASAVIVYDDDVPETNEAHHVLMVYDVPNFMAVFIGYEDGQTLLKLLDHLGYNIYVNVTYGEMPPFKYRSEALTLPIILGPVAVLLGILAIYHAVLRYERYKEEHHDHVEHHMLDTFHVQGV